jgi:hypothetical protein
MKETNLANRIYLDCTVFPHDFKDIIASVDFASGVIVSATGTRWEEVPIETRAAILKLMSSYCLKWLSLEEEAAGRPKVYRKIMRVSEEEYLSGG